MLKRVLNFFAAPVFPEDEDKTRKAKIAFVIAFVVLFSGMGFEAYMRLAKNYTGIVTMDVLIIGLSVTCVIALVELRRGQVHFASILLVVMVWLTANGLAATGFGAKDASYLTNFAIVLMAGLLLNWQASAIITVLSVASGFALAYAEQSGLISVAFYPISSFAFDITFVFVINGTLIWLLIDGLEKTLRKSRLNSEELGSANTSLRATQNELQARTSDLIIAYNQLENRSKKLHAITVIAHTTAAIRNFEHLLDTITNTISRQLGYYHVGLFLLDEQKQIAILRSANSDRGKKMQSRGYRLSINQRNPISLVLQAGVPQIYLDTGQNAGYLHNPELPDTRSELVLPLKSGDQIIGIMDIHSVDADAFSQDDLNTLSILVDQVAITIQNSFLFEQSQSALREAGITSLQNSGESWKGYEKTISTRGYRYDGIKSEPLKVDRISNGETDALMIPVQLRGQTIGRLKLSIPDASRDWTEDELAIVRATAERVALALEGARLLDEAQKRAAREAFLSEVSTKLSSSFQLDSILRDTVQELGQTLKNSTVTFQLVNPAATAITQEEPPNGASARTKESDSSNEH